MRLVNVKAIGQDESNGAPVVLLEEPQTGKVIPIWIGDQTADAIIAFIEDRVEVLPSPHDLLRRIIITLDAHLEQVIIDDVINGVCYASLRLRDRSDTCHEIDCRSSDGIALGLRTSSWIYVSEKVYHKLAMDFKDLN